MIKVFHRPRKTHTVTKTVENEDGSLSAVPYTYEDTPTSSFTLKEQDGNIVFGYKTLCCEAPTEGEFVLNKQEYKGRAVHCAIIQADVRNKQVIYDLYGRTTSDSSTRPISKAFDENFLGKFCFEENGDVTVFLYHRIDDVPGVENHQLSPDQTSTGVLLENSPLFKKIYTKHQTKARMLSGLDQLDSLAYLEVQVDALTRALLRLYNNQALDPELMLILQTSDAYSVLDIKPQEGCVNEITNKKARVRDLQQQFYAEK